MDGIIKHTFIATYRLNESGGQYSKNLLRDFLFYYTFQQRLSIALFNITENVQCSFVHWIQTSILCINHVNALFIPGTQWRPSLTVEAQPSLPGIWRRRLHCREWGNRLPGLKLIMMGNVVFAITTLLVLNIGFGLGLGVYFKCHCQSCYIVANLFIY